MSGPRDAAQQVAVRHTVELELPDLTLSSQSLTTDRRALPGRKDIDSTRVSFRQPACRADVEIGVSASGTKRANAIAMQAAEHVVRFYETDAFFLDAVATFCADAILADGAALVVATGEHRAGIAERLRARGLLDAAGTHEAYHSLDAAETLSQFMIDDEVDAARFMEVIGGLISRAAKHGRQVRVFGEMVSLLVADGHPVAALRLEELWNDLQRAMHPTSAFSLFCAYPMDHFDGEAHRELFADVCAAHSQVIPAESYAALPTVNDRLWAIAELQRKAQSLETEIAERQRAEERLRRALEAEHEARLDAEAALHVRDEFLSIAAHELRNPLACLSLHAQVALQRLSRTEHFDATRTEHSLQSICSQATRLSRLLDRLLDVSRLEADHLTLQRRVTDLTVLVEQVVSSTRAGTDRHPIALEMPVSLQAWIDPMRLEQVLANLLDNAIKHSPQGEPIVVTLSQPLPGTLELAVSDRGIGIPIEARDRIFERFFQARPEDATQGLGLGLYVSRQVVALHGGDIRADFPADGGTRFVVTLPTGIEALVDSHAAD
jgi:signal transduction histidine kinase